MKEEILKIISSPAFDHLVNKQQQADYDGVMVLVSRQALDEVLDSVAKLSITPTLTN